MLHCNDVNYYCLWVKGERYVYLRSAIEFVLEVWGHVNNPQPIGIAKQRSISTGLHVDDTVGRLWCLG